MNDRMMNALQFQLDNVNDTIESAKSAWRRDPEREARLQWRADELARMIENDIEPAKTSITFTDVLEAREIYTQKSIVYGNVMDAFNACHDEWLDAFNDYIKAKHDGLSDDLVEAARKRYEEIDKPAEALKVAEVERKKARLIYNKTAEIHVRQCEVVALRALLADLSWTKQPTRYKRMRAKVEAITDAALIGTGCRLDVYSGDGTMTVREDYAVVNWNPDKDLDAELYYALEAVSEMPDIEAMTKILAIYESDSEDSVTNVTVDDVINIVDDMYAIQDELSKMRDEYVERATNLIKPLKRFGLHRDTARAGDVDYYNLY